MNYNGTQVFSGKLQFCGISLVYHAGIRIIPEMHYEAGWTNYNNQSTNLNLDLKLSDMIKAMKGIESQD